MKCVLCGGRFRKSKGGEKYVACGDCASMRVTDAVVKLAVEGGCKPADLHSIRQRAPSEQRFVDAVCILLRRWPTTEGKK